MSDMRRYKYAPPAMALIILLPITFFIGCSFAIEAYRNSESMMILDLIPVSELGVSIILWFKSILMFLLALLIFFLMYRNSLGISQITLDDKGVCIPSFFSSKKTFIPYSLIKDLKIETTRANGAFIKFIFIKTSDGQENHIYKSYCEDEYCFNSIFKYLKECVDYSGSLSEGNDSKKKD